MKAIRLLLATAATTVAIAAIAPGTSSAQACLHFGTFTGCAQTPWPLNSEQCGGVRDGQDVLVGYCIPMP